MAQPFNPFQALVADLNRGALVVDSSSRALVPTAALLELCEAAGDEGMRNFGRAIGTEAGRRVASRLRTVDTASIDSVVEHLGGELALMGLGNLALERWGRALVLRLTGSPFTAAGDALIAAVLEGAIQRGLGRDVSVLPVGSQGPHARFAVLSAATADKVSSTLKSGTSWADALAALQGGQA